MPDISRTPPSLGRVDETLTIIEEIDARIRGVKEALSRVVAEAERLEGLSIRDHFESIEQIGLVIDEVSVEVDVLESRISTIESLRNRQK